MEITWGNKAARWFINAGKYTDYHRNLADLLMRRMDLGSTLCDLGCGIGLIDFALADRLKHITCVDISADALDILKQEADKRGIKNITAVQADAGKIEGSWDYGLMLFFHGKLSDSFPHYLRLFRRKLYYIVHADPEDTQKDYKPERTKCSSVSVIRRELDEHGISYQLSHHALEYGQPFVDCDEAVDFTKTYRLCPAGTEEAFLKARLIPASDTQPGYRFYLPHTKRFGMFMIGREDNAHI